MSFYRDASGVYRAANLDGLDWLEYGFGTRQAGGWPAGPAATVRQIHSNLCLHVDGRSGVLGEADGLITRTPATWLAIRTADCVPMLFADRRLHVVAAVHAGWRGTAANIAAAAVSGMRDRFGAEPADLLVAIGPAICGACYEVSADVAARFQPWFPERQDLNVAARIGLAEANRRQLIEAGLPAENIESGAPCTFTGTDDFYSYRRQPGERGRMVTAIRLK